MTKFTKHNSSSFPDSLYAEVHGLALLRDTLQEEEEPTLHIPDVFEVNERTLSMEAIDFQSGSNQQMVVLGKGLAKLHRTRYPKYGLDRNNYIGLSEQKNDLYEDWGEFFVERRLAFQISLIKSNSIQGSFQQILQQNKGRVIEFLNQHCQHPSLVHGDLWSGNVLFGRKQDQIPDAEGKVWLIDPAVYYGDREVDIAMTEMFGGFDPGFYQAYDEAYPLSADYAQKKVIFNLYHMLNHYNLFGSSYLEGCRQGMSVITAL